MHYWCTPPVWPQAFCVFDHYMHISSRTARMNKFRFLPSCIYSVLSEVRHSEETMCRELKSLRWFCAFAHFLGFRLFCNFWISFQKLLGQFDFGNEAERQEETKKETVQPQLWVLSVWKNAVTDMLVQTCAFIWCQTCCSMLYFPTSTNFYPPPFSILLSHTLSLSAGPWCLSPSTAPSSISWLSSCSSRIWSSSRSSFWNTSSTNRRCIIEAQHIQ